MTSLEEKNSNQPKQFLQQAWSYAAHYIVPSLPKRTWINMLTASHLQNWQNSLSKASLTSLGLLKLTCSSIRGSVLLLAFSLQEHINLSANPFPFL